MGRVFACSDLHGVMGLYKQIKAFLEPEDKVYFLGDAGDRGYASWELIKTIYADNQFIYLMGNHEKMLIDACDEYLNDSGDRKYSLLHNNGGCDTFVDWMDNPQREEWLARLRKLPKSAIYNNNQGQIIYLTHAGFTPMYDYEGNIDLPDGYDLVWDREHFFDPWPVDIENIIIVHGHTPTPHLLRDIYNMKKIKVVDREPWEPGALWYNDHKCCIDNGAFATGFTCLLDLDTFDEHIFQECDSEYGETD